MKNEITPLDRAFWLIILENWTFAEIDAWAQFAHSVERSQSWSS